MENKTVNTYKVIKSFGEALVGDIFGYDDKNDLFIMKTEEIKANYTVSRSMMLEPTIAQLLCKEGYLTVEDVTSTMCNKCEKIEKIKDFVYTQIETYKKENTEITKRYDEGKIQPCVKVESDTVHYNLLKVLNALKDIINE